MEKSKNIGAKPTQPTKLELSLKPNRFAHEAAKRDGGTLGVEFIGWPSQLPDIADRQDVSSLANRAPPVFSLSKISPQKAWYRQISPRR